VPAPCQLPPGVLPPRCPFPQIKQGWQGVDGPLDGAQRHLHRVWLGWSQQDAVPVEDTKVWGRGTHGRQRCGVRDCACGGHQDTGWTVLVEETTAWGGRLCPWRIPRCGVGGCACGGHHGMGWGAIPMEDTEAWGGEHAHGGHQGIG